MSSYGIGFMIILVAGIAIAALAVYWLNSITASTSMLAVEETAENILQHITSGVHLMKVVTPAPVFFYTSKGAAAKIALYTVYGIPPLVLRFVYYKQAVSLAAIVSSPLLTMSKTCQCSKESRIVVCTCGGVKYYILYNDSVQILVNYRIVEIPLGHWYIPYNAVSVVVNLWNYTTAPRVARIRTGSIVDCSSYVICRRVAGPTLCFIVPLEVEVRLLPVAPYARSIVKKAYVVCRPIGTVTLYVCTHVTVCQVS